MEKKETIQGSPTLIYTTFGRKFRSSEEEIQKGISIACRHGETYPKGELLFFSLFVREGIMSKGDILTRGFKLWLKRERKNKDIEIFVKINNIGI
jgi:hypothetical protein